MSVRTSWLNDIEHAEKLISNKRIKLDDIISEVPGMQFFISCITGTESSIRGVRNGRKARPGISYFLCGNGIEERLVNFNNFLLNDIKELPHQTVF